MKTLILSLAAMIFMGCHAANVKWTSLTVTVMEWVEGDHKPFWVFDDMSGVPCFCVSVIQDTLTDKFTLSFQTPADPLLAGYENPYRPNMYLFENMVFAKEGDIVSSATTRFLDDSKYAVHYGIDDNRYFFGEISDVAPSSDTYLSYICSADPVGYSENQFYYYGWVNVILDYDGSIYAYGAIDEAGGPMVVGGGAWEGGIPEPSGGILFLLGVVMLGLRRVQKLES